MSMQQDLLRDLYETGLYDIASSSGLLDDIQNALPTDTTADGIPGNLSHQPVASPVLIPKPGSAFSQLQPQSASACSGPPSVLTSPQKPAQGATSQIPEAQQAALITTAADMASSRAQSILHASRFRVNQLQQAFQQRQQAPANSADGSQKTRRKSSKNQNPDQPREGRAGGKGLRHFSLKVCEKVQAKGRTTYNEVADELVAEMSLLEAESEGPQFDEKNIRRRVYDAINVLMAMEIIQKEKKEILWKGFPTIVGSSVENLKSDRTKKMADVERKQAYLQEMIEQQRALKQLLERHANRTLNEGTTALHLPFILVQAKADATVEVKISEEMQDVQFDFYNSPFQIHDDSYVLRNMALQQQPHRFPYPHPVTERTLTAPGAVRPGFPGHGTPLQAPVPSTSSAHGSVAEQTVAKPQPAQSSAPVQPPQQPQLQQAQPQLPAVGLPPGVVMPAFAHASYPFPAPNFFPPQQPAAFGLAT